MNVTQLALSLEISFPRLKYQYFRQFSQMSPKRENGENEKKNMSIEFIDYRHESIRFFYSSSILISIFIRKKSIHGKKSEKMQLVWRFNFPK